MRKFKVTYLKLQKVIGAVPGVPIMAEQLIITNDGGKIEIVPPDGYAVAVICEQLPDLTIFNTPQNEKPGN